MTTLDFFPRLRGTTGHTPADGGCVAQLAGYLKDGSWTDRHSCLDPLLRAAAICVNDYMPESERPKLGPIAVRLIDTGDFSPDLDRHLRLAAWALGSIEPLVPESRAELFEKARKAVAARVDSWAARELYYEARGVSYGAPPTELHACNVIRLALESVGWRHQQGAVATVDRAGLLHALHGDGAAFLSGLLDEFDLIVGRRPEQVFVPTPEAMQDVLNLFGNAGGW